MKALRRRAAVAPFLVSVNPTYGAGLGRRPPQEPKHRTPDTPGAEAQRRLPKRDGRSRSRWSRRVIIDLESSPDQSGQINGVPAGRGLGEGQDSRLVF